MKFSLIGLVKGDLLIQVTA